MNKEEIEAEILKLKAKIENTKESKDRLEELTRQYKCLNWYPSHKNLRDLNNNQNLYLGDNYNEDFFYGDGGAIQVGNWNMSIEESFGGDEGDGEERWFVIKAENSSENIVEFWKIPGFYQSYHGSEFTWEDCFQVKRGKALVDVWNSVNEEEKNLDNLILEAEKYLEDLKAKKV